MAGEDAEDVESKEIIEDQLVCIVSKDCLEVFSKHFLLKVVMNMY